MAVFSLLLFVAALLCNFPAVTAAASKCSNVPTCLGASYCASYLSIPTSTKTKYTTTTPKKTTVYATGPQSTTTFYGTITYDYTEISFTTIYNGNTTYSTCSRSAYPTPANNIEARATSSSKDCPATTKLSSSKLSSYCSCVATTPTITVTSTKTAPAKTTTTVTTPPDPPTTTVYSITDTTVVYSTSSTVSADGPLVTVYDLDANSTYTTYGSTYEIYDDYVFNMGQPGSFGVSCTYGICGLQPNGSCTTPNCNRGVLDCLDVCARYVDGCVAVGYSPDIGPNGDVQNDSTCSFAVDTDGSNNAISCGFVPSTDPYLQPKDNIGVAGVLKGYEGINS